MASAMIKGLINVKMFRPDQIHCSDPSQAQLDQLREFGVHTTTDNSAVARACKILIIAVKPHIVAPAVNQISGLISRDHLLVSIAAGVTIQSISALLPKGTRVVRVMPSTPALVGLGASGYALGPNATAEDGQTVMKILSAVGVAHQLPEKNLDAVTGVSGSGPAYVFVMIEAMADGGVRAGLSREVALSLATQTVLGSAKMVLETGKHPAQLKDSVASAGGTTIAGLHELEKGAFRAAVINCVVAATNRATELSLPAKL